MQTDTAHDSRAEAMLAEARREEASKQARILERHKARLKSHAIAGSIIFFVLLLFTGATGLLGSAIMAVALGAPAGLVISLRGGGYFQGALIGTAFGAGACYLAQIVGGGGWGIDPLLLFGNGILIGGIPGVLIGAHVLLDR